MITTRKSSASGAFFERTCGRILPWRCWQHVEIMKCTRDYPEIKKRKGISLASSQTLPFQYHKNSNGFESMFWHVWDSWQFQRIGYSKPSPIMYKSYLPHRYSSHKPYL
jgi:hypothetical protein